MYCAPGRTLTSTDLRRLDSDSNGTRGLSFSLALAPPSHSAECCSASSKCRYASIQGTFTV